VPHFLFLGSGAAGSPSNKTWPGLRPTSVPSFILIHPTVWLQYTNVAERQDKQTDRQTDNSPVAQGEPFYKRTPKNGSPMLSDRCLYCAVSPVCQSEMLAHCDQMVGWIKICHLVGKYASAQGTLSQMGSQLPTPQPPKGAEQPLHFRPMSVVTKRLDESRCHLVWR